MKAKWYDVQDLNEFYNGDKFWRASNREAPHNLYTSTARLAEAVESDDWLNKNFTSWRFVDEPVAKPDPTATDLKILYYTDGRYKAVWKYDQPNNQYLRFDGAKQKIDNDNSPVIAKNVLIEYMEMKVIDKDGRHEVKTTGSGKVLLFKDGQVTTGTWKKASEDSRTFFYNDANQQMTFNRGSVWIEVVPKDGESMVEY